MANFKNLIALTSDPEDSMLSGNMAPAIKEALRVRNEKAAAEAAEELITVFDCIATYKSNRRKQIKTLRQSMDKVKKQLAAVDRALAFGQETNNFLPLLVCLGQVNYATNVGMDQEEFDKNKTVPADFVPAVTVPQPK